MTSFLLQKKVIFSARKTSGFAFDGSITYDTIDVNVGNGMQSSGFIAPESGTYGFTFFAPSLVNSRVNAYKNGNLYHSIYARFDGNSGIRWRLLNSSWMTKLTKGQVVHLEVVEGILSCKSVNDKYQMIFTGNLLMSHE